jgi:hypothetical protein
MKDKENQEPLSGTFDYTIGGLEAPKSPIRYVYAALFILAALALFFYFVSPTRVEPNPAAKPANYQESL